MATAKAYTSFGLATAAGLLGSAASVALWAVAVPANSRRAYGLASGILGDAAGVASFVNRAARGKSAGPLGVASGVVDAASVGGYSFAVVASELIRRGAVKGGDYEAVSVSLTPVAAQVHRARGAARYAVRVKVPGAPVPWDGGAWLVDKRGYFVEWTLMDVGKWLIKSLGGTSIAVTLHVKDAALLPARWTPERLAALAGKVVTLDPAALVLAANAKEATVANWLPGVRRLVVTGAADRMRQAAGVLQVVQDMQAGGPWVPA